ncbi:MAG: hypothetical protein IKT09_06335 [Synergistes sp.]|nr:hypothetical protein [Synergistes sp.]
MAYNTKHAQEKETKHSTLFVISFLCVFLCAAALGTLRLYGLYLEHRISQASVRIEKSKEENVALSRRYAQLLSPARIYNYAKCNLGMDSVANIKVITLSESSVKLVQLKEEERAEGRNFAENRNPLVNQAHAENH